MLFARSAPAVCGYGTRVHRPGDPSGAVDQWKKCRTPVK